MKLYIILTRIANCVGGAPIYHRNKIKYLEERGWKAMAFTDNRGKVLIQGLEQYEEYYAPWIISQPNSYTRVQREKLLRKMLQQIPCENYEEIVVETGTDYAAYWGEYFAEALHGRHFFYSLEENSNLNFNRFQSFYKFKFDRGELACIKEDMLECFLGKSAPAQDQKKYILVASSTNGVEDYENTFSSHLKRYDYNIGSIGRLEKLFVPVIVRGIEEFADAHPDKSIQAIFIGGTEQKQKQKEIEKALSRHPNIHCVISGFMWPIPQSVFSQIDVFASGAGSALISLFCGVPTVIMNVVNGENYGLCIWEDGPVSVDDKYQNAPLTDLFEIALVDKIVDRKQTSWNSQSKWQNSCKEFDRHMEFLSGAEEKLVYFDIDKLPLSPKRKLLKFMHCIWGTCGVDRLHRWYRKMKKIINIE